MHWYIIIIIYHYYYYYYYSRIKLSAYLLLLKYLLNYLKHKTQKCLHIADTQIISAVEMAHIVSGAALNSTHSLTTKLSLQRRSSFR